MTAHTDLSRELAVAEAAARAAGAIQVERYERLERIVHKSEKDVVTEVDHLSEAVILATIAEAFPTDAFLAEESGASGPGGTGGLAGRGAGSPGSDDMRLWIVDPLDGTVNYANGIPFFSVSVALAIGGIPSLGVVLDPLRDELFSALRGQGAHLDGAPISIPRKERIGDAVVHLGLPRTGFARQYTRFRRAVRITRAMGSATLGLAYVANGRFDAYVQWQGLSTWDVGAAGVIATEGGATVTAPDGGPWFDIGMPSRSIGIVAASPRHHGRYLEMLAGASGARSRPVGPSR